MFLVKSEDFFFLVMTKPLVKRGKSMIGSSSNHVMLTCTHSELNMKNEKHLFKIATNTKSLTRTLDSNQAPLSFFCSATVFKMDDGQRP